MCKELSSKENYIKFSKAYDSIINNYLNNKLENSIEVDNWSKNTCALEKLSAELDLCYKNRGLSFVYYKSLNDGIKTIKKSVAQGGR